MCDSPQSVYEECLPSDYGYPLWYPEPSSTLPSRYKQDGLQIGDVGYMNSDGAFNVLFNISYHTNHAINRRLGAPFNFDPVGLDDLDVAVETNALPPNSAITSHGITRHIRTQKMVGHYEFTASSTKGAILILPDGATLYNLLAKERWREFAIAHAFDWYRLAQEGYGHNGSIFLVTGYYKARSWSIASFHGATIAEDRHIFVAPRDNRCGAAGRVWQSTFGLQYRDGPGPYHYGAINQTIFLKGFKVSLRDDVLGWLSERPGILPVPSVLRRCFTVIIRFLLLLLGRKPKRRRRMYGIADINRVLGSSLISAVHDTVVQEGPTPVELMQGDRLSELLSETSSVVLQSEIALQGKGQATVTHDSEQMAWIETERRMLEELVQEDRLSELLSETDSMVSQPETYLQSNGQVAVMHEGERIAWIEIERHIPDELTQGGDRLSELLSEDDSIVL